jgi:hypothetical protein
LSSGVAAVVAVLRAPAESLMGWLDRRRDARRWKATRSSLLESLELVSRSAGNRRDTSTLQEPRLVAVDGRHAVPRDLAGRVEGVHHSDPLTTLMIEVGIVPMANLFVTSQSARTSTIVGLGGHLWGSVGIVHIEARTRSEVPAAEGLAMAAAEDMPVTSDDLVEPLVWPPVEDTLIVVKRMGLNPVPIRGGP